MALKLCHHIKEDGIWCGSAALHGRDYCYAHLTFRGRRMRSAQQVRKHTWRLELPSLDDLNAVQVAVMQVLDAIAERRLERHDAGHLLYGLHMAASNLRGKERASFEVGPSAENRCLSYDSFEEDFELIEDETGADGPAAAAGPPASADVAVAGVQEQAGTPIVGAAAGETAAAKKETAAEPAETAASSPILIEKIMAVADDDPADSPAGPDLASAVAPQAPRKLPRGLRPPKAQRQSPEEAAAAAKEVAATADECGRRDGKVRKCRDCEVKVWKRLAQFWEGSQHPDEWMPFSGTMECDDCVYRQLTTLGRHLDETMPLLFHLFMILQRDGGEDPGEFDDYARTFGASVDQTGHIPQEWAERLRRWVEGDRDSIGDPAEEENGEEETEASA